MYISGYCCINWSVCPADESFNFDSVGDSAIAMSKTGAACTSDYIRIEGDSVVDGGSIMHNNYCVDPQFAEKQQIKMQK